jgi:hypothetical protein
MRHVLLALALFAASPAAGAELLMFEEAGCPWCRAWDREVGAVYARTEEGRRAALRRVDLAAGIPPELRRFGPVRFTPTFVLLACGEEAARIIGYPGEESFWGLLSAALARVPPEC